MPRVRAMLVSGFGPTFKNDRYVAGTLFDKSNSTAIEQSYFADRDCFSLTDLGFDYQGVRYPLMRPRSWTVPHLTTFTLQAILERCGVEVSVLDTADIWAGSAAAATPEVDVVLLSTTFIWDENSLDKAIRWIGDACPGVPLVLGGQYSNLKWSTIMRCRPEVHAIVRGDAEVVLPGLLQVLGRPDEYRRLPNLVFRDRSGAVAQTAVAYADLDAEPAASFDGLYPSVPYESMRGCPFTCKFCSFPAASPKWRYKSATKIRDDWAMYAEVNGASFVKAMDSTFTVPPTRLRELFGLLPELGMPWEAYSRANTIKDEWTVEQLARSHCRTLSIGFESMSESSLLNMNKKVTAKANRTAFQLLRNSPVGYRSSFMVGYPGETPADYQETRDFLVDDYAGHFTLSVFGVSDETMPLWEDRERFQIEVLDPAQPDFSWRHIGMDVQTAFELNHDTLDAVRRDNEAAVLIIWQDGYQRWLMPQHDRRTNLRLEKTVERIAMLPRDHPDPRVGLPVLDDLLAGLATLGCHRGNRVTFSAAPLITD